MDQQYQKYALRKGAEIRLARYQVSQGDEIDVLPASAIPGAMCGQIDDGKPKPTVNKRDFFGRIVSDLQPAPNCGSAKDSNVVGRHVSNWRNEDRKVWVSYHEGFSNAVRKPITLDELMTGFR